MATTRQFGIVTSVSGLTAGICVNSLDFNDTVQTAEARNEKGHIIDIAAYSNKQTVSISGVVDTAKGELVKAGSSITISGKTYLIDNVSRKESNTDFVTVDISAQSADNANIIIVSDNSNSNG